ncbi:phosphotransferase family protein [Dietzia cinnamea]|uniref:phosphotransferase family protein n=1 Tax=Dietzia cinnamea TaxID=321318 RepID=UPI0021A973DC|nr:ecdysteroid 22-kinase family protein [Dietzia cinnamea]MCT2139947.1 ecdysteroid 22-kinase family protein [Dietzia cinnamea]
MTSVASNPRVACTPEEVTAPWLSEALGTEVRSVRTELVGTGQIGCCVVAHVDGDGLPPTLFVKLPNPDEGMRPLLHGVYRSEVLFYRDLAPTVAVRVPRARFAELGEREGEFTLVLDDVSPLVQGDQLTGLSIEQAVDCATNLAGLHGPRWCDPELRRVEDLSVPTVEDNVTLQELGGPAVDAFLSELGGGLDDDERRIMAGIAPLIAQWASGRAERFALLHADYRADNMLVDPVGSRPSLACDWQTLAVGLPGRDLGGFLGSSLTVDDRRSAEREMVAEYHRALLGHGVTGYSLDECWEDYVYGLLQTPVLGIFGWMYGTRTPRGDEMFTVLMRRSCRAIADHDALAVARTG